MTPIEQLFNYLLTIQVWSAVKILMLMALGLYLVFAFMIVREVEAMNQTLEGVFNLPIKIVAIIHFLFAIGVFILALMIL